MNRNILSIPNLITCLNAFSGCIACVYAFSGNYTVASFFIILAAIFDFFDGFAARLLKAYSPIGKELDSLADVISFGVAPSFLLFHLLTSWTSGESFPGAEYIPFFAFLIAVFSALRLAKFNVDDRQTTSFVGLPVPANALFWISFATGIAPYLNEYSFNYWIVLPIICFSSWILISEIPMFSFKFKSWGWNENKIRYIYLLLAVILISVFQIAGLAMAVVMYVIFSVLNSRFSNK